MEKHAYLSINSCLCFYHFMPTFSSFYAYVFLKNTSALSYSITCKNLPKNT